MSKKSFDLNSSRVLQISAILATKIEVLLYLSLSLALGFSDKGANILIISNATTFHSYYLPPLIAIFL